jgi:cysteine desulfurase
MYVRRGTPLEPLIVGGSHERRQRAGTENVPGIVGLGKALEVAMKSLDDGAMERVERLRDKLEAGILAIPGTRVNGAGAPRVANTTNIYFEQLEGEALVIALDLKGVAVSGGSACHSGSTEPSHVLMAMGRMRMWTTCCAWFRRQWSICGHWRRKWLEHLGETSC